MWQTLPLIRHHQKLAVARQSRTCARAKVRTSAISLLRCEAVSAHARPVEHAETFSVVLGERSDFSDQLPQEV